MPTEALESESCSRIPRMRKEKMSNSDKEDSGLFVMDSDCCLSQRIRKSVEMTSLCFTIKVLKVIIHFYYFDKEPCLE